MPGDLSQLSLNLVQRASFLAPQLQHHPCHQPPPAQFRPHRRRRYCVKVSQLSDLSYFVESAAECVHLPLASLFVDVCYILSGKLPQ